MRRDFYAGRSAARAENAMAATAHPQATLLALDILREGGNAVDAGLAALALLSVIEPQATGIGGDCFAIYAPKGRNPIGLNGSGRSPRRARLDWYRERNICEIRIEDPHAVTIPGAIDAWARLHADHGSLPWERILAPAIEAAERGYIVADRVARDWAKLAFRLEKDEVSRETMLIDGRAPWPGELHAQPRLAATLRRIAKEGRAGFYEGPVAEDIVARLNELGGLHELEDFAAAACNYVDVVSADYRGLRICEIPPNGQGVTALLMLRALEAHDLSDDVPEAQRVHLLAEATKAAFRRRDALIADPAFAPDAAPIMLSDAERDAVRAEIDPDRAGPFAPPPDIVHRDTTYLCVVDRDRNALSLINSLFEGFGTGISARESGVLLQNRGSSFRLVEDHPNAMAPRKRPMHTIIPGMAFRGEDCAMPFGVMGGHYQPAGHAALLSNMLDRGMDPQDALSAPRSFAFDGVLELEPGLSQVAANLEAKGHATKPAASPLGGGQAIWIDNETGRLVGGSDPRKDGLALGF